jgi:adenine/guanine/hypoxanthine permease
MSQTTATDSQGAPRLLERLFGLSKSGSNLRTEFVAGLTTFLTMVYIVFVNPQILGNTGMGLNAFWRTIEPLLDEIVEALTSGERIVEVL